MSLAEETLMGVRIVEVGPRDGLQNISATIPTRTKLQLIKRLSGVGLQTVELTSVVSPRAIPQLADCQTLLADASIKSLLGNSQLRLPVLVPNVKGLDIAVEKGVREVAVFVSATEGFSMANINCSVQEGLNRAKQVAERARNRGLSVRGYISCIFADPYDGPTPQAAVLDGVEQLLDMGCYEVSLGDTLGVGVAHQVKGLLGFLTAAGIPIDKLAGHFHDTFGQAVSNVWAAYECGVRVFDSSVAGLGGCPFAPGAKGNVATEDLVYMFHQAGVHTGVDLTKLAETGAWISAQLERANESRAGSALLVKARPAKSKPTQKEWTTLKSEQGLIVQKSAKSVKVTLNRPRNGNALTIAMIEDLTNLFDEAAKDAEISRIAITAKGKFFCTGMDLAKGSTPVSQGGSSSLAQYDRLTRLFDAIHNAPQVTVAGIQGPSFGGGVGLAFACDIRIAVKTANMTMTEVRLGLSPATISKHVIREWGVAFSREAMLSGRPVQPQELVRLGVVTSPLAEDDAELAANLDEYLAGLSFSAPRASGMCKELVRLSREDGKSQTEGIRSIFGEMMAPDAEGSYGVKQFQAGNRRVNWDERKDNKRVAKL